MKKILLLLLCIVAMGSCKNTWDQEAKDMYTESCMDDANRWAKSPELAKKYCNCMLEKIIKKYPDVNEALEHPDSLINDPELRKCKAESGN